MLEEFNLFDVIGMATTRNIQLNQWSIDSINEIINSNDRKEFLTIRKMMKGIIPENSLFSNYIDAYQHMLTIPYFVEQAKLRIVPLN